ncbi:hypothetical protein VSWAT3_03826 [Vibrionales bacterium SWAT-3]|nr:hypothetical protein VSWAT3_03826 [Vibrionales bacterium SWAT-3]
MSHQSASPQLSKQQQRFSNIISDANLSPKQKSSYLALEAEASLPYMTVSSEVEQALQQGVLCDMFEGHAPFKPRYVLPDYLNTCIKAQSI